MTLQEAFLLGVQEAKEAVKADICDMYEAWDQTDSTGRCGYVDELEVEVPSEEALARGPGLRV